MVYTFPAIFEPDEEFGGYCVYFPDLENVYTQGNDFKDAMYMAEDVLCMMLHHREQEGEDIPKPSKSGDIKAKPGDIINLVACDTDYYKRYFANKMVSKTVKIPANLKYDAERAGINFSQVLKTGLENILYQK